MQLADNVVQIAGVSAGANFQAGGQVDILVLFTTPFAGQPGKGNCQRKFDSTLTSQFGTIDAAASALGFPNAQALQAAIAVFCQG